ncbi:MAG: GcvT family protein [Proteobacteria bacterium]|nr:GcvT family protein [Pseudomonadota bacterium]
MVEEVRALVIGGGVVGCSCLYHLARLGLTDCVLVERDDLTSGSTWHAAGNCPTFSTAPSLMRLQQYSVALYRRLAADAAYPINYHVTGSVRLAHTRERMDEYRHVLAMAEGLGLSYELLSPQALRERHPLVELDDLRGALWDPQDGDIDPAQLTQALASGARALGARVLRFTRVIALEALPDARWHVTTDKGEFIAETVVNAAGYRAGEIMALLGQSLPLVTLSHQYLVTGDIPELADRTARVPLLRDPDVSYYLRQERQSLILGPYEHRAQAHWLEGIPEDFSYKLFPDDLERAEPYIEAACARVPVLAQAGIRRVVNGPIPYSPDGNPYIGPAHGLKNFYHCNTFSFGITQAGGAGKALAEWVVHGAPEWDLWALDPRRFTGYATARYTLARALEVYEHEYAPAFPLEERSAGRPLRCSPLHDTLGSQGARFGVRGGWERALWYQEGEGPRAPGLTFRRGAAGFEAVAAEVAAVRSGVGIADLPGFTKFMIEGAGAERFLDRLVCSKLPRPGRIALAYALNARGGIESEFTLTRLAPDRFYAVSAASAEHHDEDLLHAHLTADAEVRITPLTEAYGTLILAGPRSRELLGAVTTTDLSNTAFPWLSARTVHIADAAVWALRVNYVGELGWELHVPRAELAAVYARLREAGRALGLRHFGLYAIDSLRMDKAYRGWKSDLEGGFTPLDAGLERFVDLRKGEFVGRAVLLRQERDGARFRMVTLLLEERGDADALPASPVFRGAERIGEVTSGAYSHTLGRSLALAYLRRAEATEGARVSVTVLGEARAARVALEAPWDPGNQRPRA